MGAAAIGGRPHPMTTRLQEMVDCSSVLVGAQVIRPDAVDAWLSNDADDGALHQVRNVGPSLPSDRAWLG